MSITDELREWVTDHYSGWKSKQAEGIAIADRIDAEHKKACDDAWDNGYEADYLGIEKWLTEHPQVMEHHGWIRLPKDADGEVIRIGDKLIDEDDKPQKPAIVKCILYNDGGCVVSGIDPRGCWYDPSLLRHYHAPTVEDVLREFAYGLGVPVADSYVAATAAKLKLADGEDA